MQNDNIIETDYSYIHSEPLVIYSRQILDDENVQDTVYGTDEEFNTVFYGIEESSDPEASEQKVSDQASISKPVISTLCAHSNFALDMLTYTKTSAIHSFHPTVIHATYLYSD